MAERINGYGCVQLEPGTDLFDKYASMRVGEVIANVQSLLNVATDGDVRRKTELDELHKQLTTSYVSQCEGKTKDLFEVVAVMGMVACSLIATYLAQVDRLGFEYELMRMERGGK